jgi:hypothetical protein
MTFTATITDKTKVDIVHSNQWLNNEYPAPIKVAGNL